MNCDVRKRVEVKVVGECRGEGKGTKCDTERRRRRKEEERKRGVVKRGVV